MYTQTSTGEEHYSSVDEILHWISSGPVLRPPSDSHRTEEIDVTITTPAYIPATIQYVPTTPYSQHTPSTIPLQKQRVSVQNEKRSQSDRNAPIGRQRGKQRVSELNGKRASNAKNHAIGRQKSTAQDTSPLRRASSRVNNMVPPPMPQRTSTRIRRVATAHFAYILDGPSRDGLRTITAPCAPPGFERLTVDEDSERFRLLLEEMDRRERHARPGHMIQDRNNNSDGDDTLPPSCLLVTIPTETSDLDIRSRPMPKMDLPPIFPTRPLNLNLDGTPINYKKSHSGPHAEYWDKADGEEIERLFVTGTIRPEVFSDIPRDRVITYVNPVCVEKTNDDGSMKFRTRLTIGGDRIQYPYDTAAVTAEIDAIKILINCMISEDASWSTLDLTDFYLGTDLPHPEYIRIPRNLIPEKVIDFYKLQRYFSSNALYCSVHKTHYGLPQAGALSQQRLFRHLKEHGYTQIPSSPSVFRNQSGSIRFALVVDDFAVVWTDQASMDHFVRTLTLLYQVKVNWAGSTLVWISASTETNGTLPLPWKDMYANYCNVCGLTT
jgi:hypothetical protein